MILGDSYGQNSGHNHVLQKRVLSIEEELWASGPTSFSGAPATVAKLHRPHDSNRRYPRWRCQQGWLLWAPPQLGDESLLPVSLPKVLCVCLLISLLSNISPLNWGQPYWPDLYLPASLNLESVSQYSEIMKIRAST